MLLDIVLVQTINKTNGRIQVRCEPKIKLYNVRRIDLEKSVGIE